MDNSETGMKADAVVRERDVPKSVEMDLFELAVLFWKDRTTIILIVVSFVLMGSTVAYLTPRTWKGEAIVRPVVDTALDKINQTDLWEYFTPIEAFDMFHEAVLSVDVQKRAFENMRLNKQSDGVLERGMGSRKKFEKFRENLTIERVEFKTEKLDSGRLMIVYRSADVGDVDDVINDQIIPLATSHVLNQLEERYKSLKVLKKNEIDLKVKELAESYYYDLAYSLKETEQAYELAKSQNIIQNHLESRVMTKEFDSEIYYLLGTKYLEEKMKLLKNKLGEYGSGRSHIPEVSKEMYKLKVLDAKSVDFSSVNVVDVEISAEPPVNHEKPSRVLIIFASAVLGVFVAVLISFLKIAYRIQYT